MRRCLNVPSLRDELGETLPALLHLLLTKLEEIRRALSRDDIVAFSRGLLDLSPRTIRQGADSLELVLEGYGARPGRAELEELIRSKRAYVHYLEHIK